MEKNRMDSRDNVVNTLNFQELFKLIIHNWYWFVLSIIISLLIAALYLLSTNPIYTRSASVMLKVEDSSGSSSLISDLTDFGGFGASTNVNNEILALKSPILMRKVVEKLRLDERYLIKSGLRERDLYRESPIIIAFQTQEAKSCSFSVKLETQKRVVVSNFKVGREQIKKEVRGQLGESLKTPAGNIVISASALYDDHYIGKTINYSKSSVRDVAKSYSTRLKTDLGIEKGTIIELKLSDVSPSRAADVLSGLIDAYNDTWVEDKNQASERTSELITERLGALESELGMVDSDISAIKSVNMIPDLSEASSLAMRESAENQKRIMDLNNKIISAQYIRDILNSNTLSQTLPVNSGIENASIEHQIGEYNNIVIERNKLVSSSSENNPLVKDLTNSLIAMQSSIKQAINIYMSTLNTQLASMQRRESITGARISSSPTKAKDLLSHERQQKVKESLYLYLLQKREENELSKAYTSRNTKLINDPDGADSPTSPVRSRILIMAVLLGFLVPASILYFKETTYTKIRSRKDLENLSIPFVGEIPKASGSKKLKLGMISSKDNAEDFTILVKDQGKDIVNEAFRVIRTNLQFMIGRSNNKVIMMSSFNPGSGKTFISMNLATSFALNNKKVLVIDLDLRKGSLSKYVDAPRLGVSSYLSGQTDNWHNLVISSKEVSNLSVLPLGVIPPNPTELLLNGTMEKLFDEARQEYDFVFVDCPPVEIVADTSIVGNWVDMTVFIIRAELLEREMLGVLDEYYREQKYKNMCVILNGTKLLNGYGYGYGYGYSYGK